MNYVAVGTTNPAKLEAVSEALRLFEIKADLFSYSIESIVSAQPISLDETIKGSRFRAEMVYDKAIDLFNSISLFSIGIESGLMKVPHSNTGYFNVSVSTIYDGHKHYMGFSPGFEFPRVVIDDVFQKGIESTQSFYERNLTLNPKIGSAQGIIGVLSKGIKTRKDYTVDSLIMALSQYVNKDLY